MSASIHVNPRGPVEVRVSEYVFSHGHAPAGAGHWGFHIGSALFWAKKVERGVLVSHLPYGEAKALAVAEARRQGVSSIRVGS